MTGSGAEGLRVEDAIRRFEFKTKAQNLAQLRDWLTHATVLPLEVVTVAQWQKDASAVLERINSSLGARSIIVRSSAADEDSLMNSHAGAFESVADVDSSHHESVAAAFEAVIQSYRRRASTDVDDYEILVQPMVSQVRVSGVLFTRDLDRNSPYFVLNYDDQSSRTDTVTAGSAETKNLRVFKRAELGDLDPDIQRMVRMARELEEVTGSDALDIEFAIDVHDQAFLLQVRPLVWTRVLSVGKLDRRVSEEIGLMKHFVRDKLAPKPQVFGERAILGEMPDWNPAEIIGTHPKPLAQSLYRYLIMDSIWREAREVIGYRNPDPYQLMTVVSGRPYVDVRASFNSFLPAGLPEPLCEKLVEYYLDRLRAHPEFHDKVEFEIIVSCLWFDFDVHAERLLAFGFSTEEVDALRQALHRLTESIVTDKEGVLRGLERRVDELASRREATMERHRSVSDVPMTVEQLLADCRTYGTLPFSVFARCAFIGTSFLRSLIHQDVLTADEYNLYVQGIDTVASEFVTDLDACKAGAVSRDEFLARYGHLRPGTYDICTFTYSERPDLYLSFEANDSQHGDDAAHADEQTSRSGSDRYLSDRVARGTERLLAQWGYSFQLAQLDDFIKKSIRLREFVKFEFSKNLSAALDLIVEFGRYHGLSREDLSHLEINDILRLSNENVGEDYISHLRTMIERSRTRTEVTAAISLPDLIFSERDVEVAALQRRRPNFTSHKKVVADTYVLEEISALEDVDVLRDKIVLIENADPGYDWLFGKSIAGLITKYGGAASHMAIRCAEFGLPAAIGCGEQIFEELRKSRSILLDCVEKRVEPYAS